MFLILAVSPAHALENWTQVADRGLGLGTGANLVNALAIFDGYVYLGTRYKYNDHDAAWPIIYRAPLSNDESWSLVAYSDYYFPHRGDVTGMAVAGGELWLGTEGGDLLHHRSSGGFYPENPRRAWSETKPILAVAAYQPDYYRPEMPCIVRDGLEVWCKDSSGWVKLPLPRELRDATIRQAELHAMDRRLFLGVGGGTIGSRACALYEFYSYGYTYMGHTAPWHRGRWSRVTGDCFGDSGATWLTSMQSFQGWLYVAAGDHYAGGRIYRTRGPGSYFDVTPPAGAPVFRWPSMAVSDGRLFVGAHVQPAGTPGGAAGVFVTEDGTSWSQSNQLGFGSDFNLTTNALVGQGDHLYAGTLNGAEGFEVWKTQPLRLPACGFEFVCDFARGSCGLEWVCR
jgi:hypothetical protein